MSTAASTTAAAQASHSSDSFDLDAMLVELLPSALPEAVGNRMLIKKRALVEIGTNSKAGFNRPCP